MSHSLIGFRSEKSLQAIDLIHRFWDVGVGVGREQSAAAGEQTAGRSASRLGGGAGQELAGLRACADRRRPLFAPSRPPPSRQSFPIRVAAR